MEQNENKIIIVDEQGRERVCEILFTYQHPETEKNYVVLYPIDELDSDDEEMDSFLFSLGCYSGEPITVISHLKGGCIVSIKDGRYHIDNALAEAILIWSEQAAD